MKGVGVTADQLEPLFLTPLFVAGWGRQQGCNYIGVARWVTSVAFPTE